MSYAVHIDAAVQRGAWVRLGNVPVAGWCGRRNNSWVSQLERGVHRVHVITDISFLSESHSGSDNRCGWLNAAEGKDAPEPPVENVIQRERRELPAVSFGIFPDLLGAPAVQA